MNLLKVQGQYNFFLSPIRRLPSELLSQIFLSCIDPPSPLFHSQSVIPQLWTDLSISGDQAATYRSRFASACHHCITKSGSLELSVTIDRRNSDADGGSPSIEDIGVLFSASNRIVAFTLYIEPCDWADAFIRQFEQTSVPALREITLSSLSIFSNPSPRTLSVRLDRRLWPSLRTISTSEGSIDVDASHDVLNNIADLTWNGHYRHGEENIFPIIHACSNAEHLSFSNAHVWITPREFQRGTLAMKRLTITCGNQGVTGSILRGLSRFHCPSLSSFSFKSGTKIENDEVLPRMCATDLARFIRGSGCVLQKLELINFALPPDRLRLLLQCVPRLEDLSLSGCATSKTGDGCLVETLEVLMWGASDSVLPELRSLRLDAEASAVGARALLDVMLSRQEKLRKVVLWILYRHNAEELNFELAFDKSQSEEMKSSCRIRIRSKRL